MTTLIADLQALVYQLEEKALAARAPELRDMMDIAGKMRSILSRATSGEVSEYGALNPMQALATIADGTGMSKEDMQDLAGLSYNIAIRNKSLTTAHKERT